MAEHLLDGAEVGPGGEEVGREAVPEGVRRGVTREPGEADGAGEDPPDAPVGEPSSARDSRKSGVCVSLRVLRSAAVPAGTRGARRPPSPRTGRSVPSSPSRASGAGGRRGRRREGRARRAPRRAVRSRRGAREARGRAPRAARPPRRASTTAAASVTERVRGSGRAARGVATARAGFEEPIPSRARNRKKVRRAERCRPTEVFDRPCVRRCARYDRTARTSASAAETDPAGRDRNSPEKNSAKLPTSRRYAVRVCGETPRSSRR